MGDDGLISIVVDTGKIARNRVRVAEGGGFFSQVCRNVGQRAHCHVFPLSGLVAHGAMADVAGLVASGSLTSMLEP
jgi:hypothetical protein